MENIKFQFLSQEGSLIDVNVPVEDAIKMIAYEMLRAQKSNMTVKVDGLHNVYVALRWAQKKVCDHCDNT